jgi:uncharacterized Zn-finger protein
MQPVGQSLQTPLETPLETIVVNDDRIACDGTGGSLGHPRVYLNLAPKGEVDCPYCGRHYVLKAGARTGHGH